MISPLFLSELSDRLRLIDPVHPRQTVLWALREYAVGGSVMPLVSRFELPRKWGRDMEAIPDPIARLWGLEDHLDQIGIPVLPARCARLVQCIAWSLFGLAVLITIAAAIQAGV